jgi:hypothetical protein
MFQSRKNSLQSTIISFKRQSRSYFIYTDCMLTEEQRASLNELLEYFPHGATSSCHGRYDNAWVNDFRKIDWSHYSDDVLLMAANAFDYYNRSMLSIACEWGSCLDIVATLIKLGADINIIEPMKSNRHPGGCKVALHWAIVNKLSYKTPDSTEAAGVVKLLLENGADHRVTCYEGKSVLEYAQSRGYTAAVRLINDAEELRSRVIIKP